MESEGVTKRTRPNRVYIPPPKHVCKGCGITKTRAGLSEGHVLLGYCTDCRPWARAWGWIP